MTSSLNVTGYTRVPVTTTGLELLGLTATSMSVSVVDANFWFLVAVVLSGAIGTLANGWFSLH